MPTLAAVLLLAGAATPIEGRWINPARSVIIRIAPCEEDALCGTVEWASDKAKADASRGTETLVGSQLLTGFKAKGGGRWSGRIFVADANRRVSGKIVPVDEQRLKVSGCALGKNLCRSQIWTRVEPQ